jgi:pilus assembly protein CpaB
MPLRLALVSLLLFTGLGLGLVGYLATRPPTTVSIATPEAPPAPLMIDVFAAARGLPAGTLMKEADFTRHAVPSANVPKGALTDSPETRAELSGALLRRYLDAGSTLMAGDVLQPRDRGFLAAVLAPGSRAISVGVDAVTGNGGLIWPGDRVDVILTQEMGEKEARLSHRFVAEMVLNDVRVVAVDQSIIQGAITTLDNVTGRLARTVTLEVTPQQAEKAAVAERLGKLTLAIRAADGAIEAAGPRGLTYGGDVSAALADAPEVATTHVQVIEGKDARDVTFQRDAASAAFQPK